MRNAVELLKKLHTCTYLHDLLVQFDKRNMKSNWTLQICIHCHRQWVQSTQYTIGVWPNFLHSFFLQVLFQFAICLTSYCKASFIECSTKRASWPLQYVTTDSTAVTGCKGGFEADCPGQSCWWYHRPGNSCPVWLEGPLQLPHCNYSEILSCWTVAVAVAEPREPENLNAGSVREEKKESAILSIS